MMIEEPLHRLYGLLAAAYISNRMRERKIKELARQIMEKKEKREGIEPEGQMIQKWGAYLSIQSVADQERYGRCIDSIYKARIERILELWL